ncbi:MAG: D-xylose transport system permease protein [Micromonosporaceae bacterium]
MTTVDTSPRTRVPGSENRTLNQAVRQYVGRIRGGDMGALPAILGLIVLCTFFGIKRPVFFSDGNFANLFTQGAQVTIIAMGLVFVLLIGEIDLSAGFASGLCASVMCVLLTKHHVPWYVSVLAAVAVGVVIGLTLGSLVAKVRIPSFVVTLAAFLAFQGIVLLLLGGGNAISVFDGTILAIDNNNMPPWLGWVILIVCAAGFALQQMLRIRSRSSRGLGTDPLSLIALRVLLLVAGGGLAVYFLNQERSHNPLRNSLKGVPIVVAIILVLLLVWTFILSRTTYGRHLYAVGGSAEAARRAGINVDRIRISAFVICSSVASIGGIVAVSRANSVDSNTGGSNILLYAVAAAVIGGTSLFGGKGRVLDAILGGAVIAVIDNGMGLLGLSSGAKFGFTGLVLLLAAGVDALSRRRAAATGLR